MLIICSINPSLQEGQTIGKNDVKLRDLTLHDDVNMIMIMSRKDGVNS